METQRCWTDGANKKADEIIWGQPGNQVWKKKKNQIKAALTLLVLFGNRPPIGGQSSEQGSWLGRSSASSMSFGLRQHSRLRRQALAS